MRRNGTPEDLLTRPGPLAILLCLLHRGPQTHMDLQAVVGVQSGTIRYHVQAMRAAGLVTVESSKPSKVRILDEKAVTRALDKLQPFWRSGGIPRGPLWREVQAAIDTRRIRGRDATNGRRPAPQAKPQVKAQGRAAMRYAVLALGCLFPVLALSGCLDPSGFGGLSRPDYSVSRTPLAERGWNTDSTFFVQVQQEAFVEVRIEAAPDGGGPAMGTAGPSNATTPVSFTLPDGTWTVTYFVDGYEWETFEDVRVDTVAPEIRGLPSVIRAPDGSATIGAGVDLESGASLFVKRQDDSAVSDTLPFQVSGLPDGVHVYHVVATDRAGNEATATVQVVAGSATELPDPKYTAGIVARYTTAIRLWDLEDLESFVSPATARSRVLSQHGSEYIGSGKGLTPDDAAVRRVVDDVVQPGMNTGEAALALYRWIYDNLEYDRARLDKDDLLDPAQTIEAGGGVCRDLAALYASLLRAAGIPARLVAGYLTGEVNGFHAWVEFYGGVGPSPWVPVDVTGINGPYKVAGMLQAFGVALPGHLAMRVLTPAEEQTDWSTAALLSYKGGEPDAPFLKEVEVVFETKQDLCVNLETLARAVRNGCLSEHNARIEGFPVVASRVLDYGIDVRSAPNGAELTLSLVYPDLASVSPDQVVYRTYFEPDQAGVDLRSAGFSEDPARGRADAVFTS